MTEAATAISHASRQLKIEDCIRRAYTDGLILADIADSGDPENVGKVPHMIEVMNGHLADLRAAFYSATSASTPS